MEEFTGLEPGDIVFSNSMAEDEVLVQIGWFRFPGHRQDQRTIQITGRAIMSSEEPVNPEEEAKDQEPLIQDTSEIPIQLEFSIGKTSLSLAELKQIGKGYVFELDAGFDHPVTLLANGAVIGRGEIVDVDGRIGVRIVDSREDAGI
jgi:type III secretion system YscQ/HrcQ family protein